MNYSKLYLMTLPRSGATLIAQHLGQHTNLFHIGESMYWELIDPKNTICSCGTVDCEFLRNIAANVKNNHYALPLLKTWQIIDNKYWPSKTLQKDSIIRDRNRVASASSFDYWLARCPSALDKIISAYQRHSTKQVFLDNTKLFHIAEILTKKRNDWGIIILLRDPRGIMSSYKNAGIRKGDYREAQSILPFCSDFMKMTTRLDENNNVFTTRYEDFCSNPQGSLTRICDFIGIQFETNMLSPINVSEEAKGHVLKGNHVLRSQDLVTVNADHSWTTNLNRSELEILYSNKQLLQLYNKFNYNIG